MPEAAKLLTGREPKSWSCVWVPRGMHCVHNPVIIQPAQTKGKAHPLPPLPLCEVLSFSFSSVLDISVKEQKLSKEKP